ncbi:unnamed protein product [Ambrosiozyma monospora]|uniref:Unnamed protein product n=1 Tax=Ambrosiozyma monospora TaxID=43982 RepID=A0A9W6T712_AMBMO|nr:unnamed protein product [Ambrosiozyma monospora]
MIPAVQRLVSSAQQTFLPERSIHRTIQTTKVMAQFIKSGAPSHSDQQQQQQQLTPIGNSQLLTPLYPRKYRH